MLGKLVRTDGDVATAILRLVLAMTLLLMIRGAGAFSADRAISSRAG